VNGPLITNDIGLLTRAAIDGVGLAFMSEEQAGPHRARGPSCGCSKTGAHHSLDSFCTTRAGGSSPLHSRR
jgi:hypothetical protein